VSARLILVYHADPREARAYADAVRLPGRGFRLAVCSTEARARRLVADAEIVYAWNLPARLVAAAPRLRWIQQMGAGVERYLAAGLPPDVILTRAAGIFGPWMAEYTIGWCLWATQRMDEFRSRQRRRQWTPADPRPLRGTTLCVVGLGDIGRAIARTARALGMAVVGVSRSGRPCPDAERVYPTARRRRALGQADWVVLTVPLHPGTRHLIGAAELAEMKRSAYLINVARGPVVDERALLAALRRRRIAGAVLDVFDQEPLPPRHPFWKLDNVVVTPHVSGPSTVEEIAPIFNDNLRRYVAGRPLRHVVDPRRGY
jgi:phosphoglycerate dehydrogenase-like enzyme